nr:MAG TPA: hypothetical protein [Bacteriophage sp.]
MYHEMNCMSVSLLLNKKTYLNIHENITQSYNSLHYAI